jgi:small ligand-binding sensory domain FIST
MPFAAALSIHPDPATAVAEAAGQVLETLGGEVDLAVVFVTAAHAPFTEEVADVVRTVLHPGTLLGATAVSVLANGAEIEDSAAIALWAGTFGAVTPVRFGRDEFRMRNSSRPNGVLVLGDPFSFDAEAAFAEIEARWPGLPVIGGMASSAHMPRGNRLVLDDEVFTDGAVGAFLGEGIDVEVVVSQGCTPIGQPWSVTRAQNNVVHELAGRPPMARLAELAERELSEAEVTAVNRGGLHVGRVVDEHKADFERGDFLVRNLVGASQREGWIAINDNIEVGDTLQFHLRDADTADDDLRALLGGKEADAALVFTCNGRGVDLFGEPDHDAKVVAEYLGRPAAAGLFCAGEFGPIGGRNFVHGFTASIALLREARVGSDR